MITEQEILIKYHLFIEKVAKGRRPDGTYNYCREALEKEAKELLASNLSDWDMNTECIEGEICDDPENCRGNEMCRKAYEKHSLNLYKPLNKGKS